MSADSVDDLHAAEDMAGTLAAALERLLDTARGYNPLIADAGVMAKVRLAEWEKFCRPTCGAHGDPEVADGECEYPDTCGCPCGHTDKEGAE